jgi:predicted HTH transcriptional regulator
MTLRIFISSVQKEFAAERAALRDYLRGDALLRRFFEAFLFEEVPAADRRADELYLDEVEHCDVYVGLFGNEYGFEDAQGISPTEREFELATRRHKHRLIFVKGADDRAKHPKMQALIRQANAELIRRRFMSSAELIGGLYAALVQYLETKQLIRSGPFDAAVCADATLADLSTERIQRFVRIARRARGFPLAEDTAPEEILKHLHLLRDGRLTHAAVLLFGTAPQRFLISSEVKCAHFHGAEVRKPIPSYQVYKGTVFELVDQAVDFVLSKINLAVGTRAESTQAPVAYEMPPEVVREAIVNAVAHRDYTSNGSVQVMLFSDRLEVWNPGTLPPSLTLEQLRHPHGSVPGNPLLAEPLYLTKYIERMGTGTGDMIERCRKAGLPEPEFKLTDGFVIVLRRKPEGAFKAVGGQDAGQVAPPVTGEVPGEVPGQGTTPPVAGEVAGEVTGEVAKLLLVCHGAKTRKVLRETLLLKGDDNFRRLYLVPALEAGLLEMTIPTKPNSRLQKYRLTPKGEALQTRLHQRYQST